MEKGKTKKIMMEKIIRNNKITNKKQRQIKIETDDESILIISHQ